jgi:enoyl-CoA hydratase
MSDIVIATESAKFGHPEVKLGTMPGAGGTQRISQVAGKHKAMDMLLTGRLISANEAHLAGLVSRVVPDTNLWLETKAIASQIASLSPPVVRLIKQAVSHGVNNSLRPGLALERRLFHLTFALADRSEGMSAFVQKRKPCFKGR